MRLFLRLAPFFACVPVVVAANPAMECGIDLESEIVIGKCLADLEVVVDQTIEIALERAMSAAKDLDARTGGHGAEASLAAGQAAWSSYRDAHCGYVGTLTGGMTASIIAVASCRVELGRTRVSELVNFSR